MGKNKTTVLLLFILSMILLVTGCSTDEEDRIFDEAMSQIDERRDQEVDNNGYPSINDDNSTPTAVSELSGTLTILTGQYDNHLQFLARHFVQLHPNVQIEFVREDLWIIDINQQIALTTRLLAAPPDIMNTGYVIFEKFSMETVFVDLNELLDGSHGINRSDYFDNILRGAEVDGRLYSVPLMVMVDTVLPNKYLFESIGVDVTDMRKITLDEYLAFYLQAVDANPDEEVLVDIIFNIMHIFNFEQLYNLETGEVNVNTPEMVALLTLVKEIPVGRSVEFTPEYVTWEYGWLGSPYCAIDDRTFFSPSIAYMYTYNASLYNPYIFLAQEIPGMRFLHPMHRITNTGEIRFMSNVSTAIMRDSPNKELAWDFIRFCMEFPYSFIESLEEKKVYVHGSSFPVNRHMFDDHVRLALNMSYDTIVRRGQLEVSGDEEKDAADRERRIEHAVFRYTELIEMVNSEDRTSRATINSLIYPDIYLFITDRQDVHRTLENIQNRLELYVAE
jgi:ABC-type glycerol-3-phosphate transport system substrate-binding protein